MAKYYSIGTAELYDAMPVLPLILTTNGGVSLNAPIAMAVGAKVEIDKLALNELAYPEYNRFFHTQASGASRMLSGILAASNNGVVLVDKCSAQPSHLSMAPLSFVTTSSNSSAIVDCLYCRAGTGNFARSFVGYTRIKNEFGVIVWKWLDRVSDYKTNPPSATVYGTLEWYKSATDNTAIYNYLTVALAVSAITVSNPTEPITIYVLDRSTDVSGIPTTINGQPVTVDYTYALVVTSNSFTGAILRRRRRD